ncbi:unnamed protein product [Rhizophagus irregularis]|nr:unnamed protein product [Rhizophagus irregularis]
MSFINENQLVSDKNSNPVKIDHENCYNPDNKKYWCKECVPRCIIEGWTSGSDDIDNFIKDTIYDACEKYVGEYKYGPSFLEWVPFDRFKDMKEIGEGGFAKAYSATWTDGDAKYTKQDDGNWIKREPAPLEIALKRLNGSQIISPGFINELKTHWKLNCSQREEIKAVFEEADKETLNISTLYEKKPDAIYTSRAFTFKNLSKPINSSFIGTTYLNEEDCQDSQLINLKISSILILEDEDNDN